MALTTTQVVPPAVAVFYSRMLLRRSLPKLVHMRVAQRKSLKTRSGNTIKFRRLDKLPIQSAPLLEGVPPQGREIGKFDIIATIQQYGDFTPLSDLEQITLENPMLREATDLLGDQASESMDSYARDVFAAGSSVFRGGASTVTLRTDLLSAAHKIDTTVQDRIIRLLMGNDATLFTEMVDASTKQATFPIRGAFWGITDEQVIFTAETLPGWKSVEEYSSKGSTLEAEMGAYKNLRWLSTTLAKKFLGGGGAVSGDVQSTGGVADVHTGLVFGTDAVATVPLEGHSLENIIKPTGSGGVSDPLNQVATSGWKHTGARVRLNESWMTRGEWTVALTTP